jgi:hypothetical protein
MCIESANGKRERIKSATKAAQLKTPTLHIEN